ncbi:TPA: hypothetical protein N0F65_002889 [Lagenidium giganteum]|uniref:Pseudouridine synthase RsuA/RluA-like domain-containing protein n=1 Tax=Lagenidium giganteum TaxID=4803 RepID=A0AAV2ZAY4_9STRA|nr:TPA: hypothetical protein N0F65_002889 [Lagenidium giganteum]
MSSDMAAAAVAVHVDQVAENASVAAADSKRAGDGNERQPYKRRKKGALERQNTPAPVYTFANGYRMVKPYVYEFRTYAKERWYSLPLLTMFTKEFNAHTPEYYDLAIRSGRITVNRELASVDTIIKNGDLIIHKTHRHEPPVSGEDIPIVYEDDELLAVIKPSSIATHPCGAYRHNSLHTIVQHMRPDLPRLFNVYRLDRLTSGVIVFAKSSAKANELSQCIANREASKTYLARVRGQLRLTPGDDSFYEQLVATAKRNCAASTVTIEPTEDNPDELVLRINCPLRCLSNRDGVHECHEEGKPSETLVRVHSTPDSETTVVECKPVTGRTHQIRLHLQLIGFPIANDPCYGGELHYGESQARLDAIAVAKAAQNKAKDSQGSVDVDLITPQQPNESEEEFMSRTCSWCRIGDADAFNETQLHCSKIWLHALEYKLAGHVFKSPYPVWAQKQATSEE